MKKASLITLAACTALVSFCISCNKDDDNPPPQPLTLYDSLGGTMLVTDPANTAATIEQGRLGIRSVVDSTIFVIAADPVLNPYFAALLSEVGAGDFTGFETLSENLTDFFCVATGATNFTYTGLNMTDAHNPAVNSRMNGTADDAAFDQFITDLVAGATKNALPDYLIARVGEVVETQRSFVVQR